MLLFYCLLLFCSNNEWNFYCKDSSDYNEDQKSNIVEKKDSLDRLLISAWLEKEKHKANFATFTNVLVSQRLLYCLIRTIPMGAEVPTGTVGLHRRIRHYRSPPPMGGGDTYFHQHYHLHRCHGDGKNPHHNAGRTGRNIYRAHNVRCARLDMHLYGFSIQPSSHSASSYQPRYHKCKALSPPQPPAG